MDGNAVSSVKSLRKGQYLSSPWTFAHERCYFLWTHQYVRHPIVSWYSITLHSLVEVFNTEQTEFTINSNSIRSSKISTFFSPIYLLLHWLRPLAREHTNFSHQDATNASLIYFLILFTLTPLHQRQVPSRDPNTQVAMTSGCQRIIWGCLHFLGTTPAISRVKITTYSKSFC